MRKLPAVTALFWVIKILATTLGESAANVVSQTLNVGYLISSLLFVALFGVSLFAQLRAKRFHPVVFWSVILTTSIAGTAMSDLMNRTGGLGYTGGALVLTTCLLIVFVIWWRSGQTLDVEKIATFKGEILYWVATLISNTLGTSSGDFLAHDTGLGPRLGALLLGAALALILAAHYLTPIAGTLLFWMAYVLTRPFGADAENALSKPRDEGGLDWGEVIPSGILGALLIGLVVYQTVTHRRQPAEAGDRGSG